jgi:hypothetical protein
MCKAKFIVLCFILSSISLIAADGNETLPLGSQILWSGTSLNLHDNVFLPSYGYSYPPFDTSSSPTRIIRTVVPQTIVRFYTPGLSGPLGSWATAASEVRGLTPEQVWDRLALPQNVPPTHAVMMMMPTRDIAPGMNTTGAWLIGGYVAPIAYTEDSFSRNLSGGAYQYFLLGPNKPAGMVATLTSAEYGVPAVVFQSGNYTTNLILNQDGSSNQGRLLNGTIPVFSYRYSSVMANGSKNVQTISAALDEINPPSGSPLYGALYQPLDIYWIRGQDEKVAAAIARINPEDYGAVVFSRLHGMAGLLDALESHWDGEKAGQKDGIWHIWGSVDARTNRLNDWHSDEGRTIFGADRQWSEHWRAGAFVGGGLSRTDWQASGRANEKNISFGLYAHHESSSAWYFNLAAMGGMGWVESQRNFSLLEEPLIAGSTSFGVLAYLPDQRTPKAEFKPWDAAAHFMLGYEIRSQRVHFKPRIQMDGLFCHIPGFTESGAGALNLSYDDLGGQALRVQTDLTVSFPLKAGSGFEPWLRAGMTRYEELGSPQFNARFTEGGQIRIQRLSMDRTSGVGAAGLDWRTGKWIVSGRAEGEWGGIESYGVRISIQRKI